jgi:hypothetical protein
MKPPSPPSGSTPSGNTHPVPLDELQALRDLAFTAQQRAENAHIMLEQLGQVTNMDLDIRQRPASQALLMADLGG